MKYPLDQLTADKFFGHLIANDRAQRKTIEVLTQLLTHAMSEMGAEDTDWYPDAELFFKHQKSIKMDHDNRLFNEKNGHAEPQSSMIISPETVQADYSDVKLGPSIQFDPEMNARTNEAEKSFGTEMSEEELAKIFNAKPAKKKAGEIDMSEKEPFKGMTLDEIETWEAKQENNNDIYKVKARVKNHAVSTGAALTAVGEMMVNSFVHVAKDLYDFAETIPDKSLRIALTERIRKHETMPANLIAAASAGVTVKPGPKR